MKCSCDVGSWLYVKSRTLHDLKARFATNDRRWGFEVQRLKETDAWEGILVIASLPSFSVGGACVKELGGVWRCSGQGDPKGDIVS